MKNGVRAAVAAALAAYASGAIAQEQETIEEVVVIGSRIPRLKQEGPAPITTIDSNQIEAEGLTNVPDLLKTLTQNSGATQSQQSFGGASFTPGAEQVDLRGLGPNHSLVLVNGRRIADFPLPLGGLSNFTDISNIPIGMIDKVEVLSGSSSAIYGSDAIAGVVNFVLKKDVEGIDFSYRYGTPTEDGGGQSHRLSLSSGITRDAFHAVFGLELLDKKPLWAFDRSIQDSTEDRPVGAPLARRDFLRIEPNEEVYIDPGQETCDNLAGYNKGSIIRGVREGWGPYDDELEDYGPGYFCGSYQSVSWGTIESSRRGATGFASLNYDLSDSTTLFADVLVGVSKVKLFRDVLNWNYMDELGNEDGSFFNTQVGDLDNWYRQFTPEEMGGLERGYIKSDQTTITVTPGIKGGIGEKWNYEAYLNYSRYELKVGWPQVVAGLANEFFLGPQLGVDEDSGLAIFDADPERLYTPLTPAEFDSITAYTTYHPESQNTYGSFTLTTGELFSLPAGGVGFAANIEAGNQSYDLKPDPLALGYYYFSWRDQDGHGSRNRWSGSYELRIPVAEKLEVSTAGRYDSYHFGGNDVGKFTYNLGVQFRPVESLLVRGYYGTGFRAPDLHYVFAGEGQVESGGNDYYLCRTTQEPGEDIADCDFADIGFLGLRSGNRDLKPETSKSWGAGVVWSPTENFKVSLDYFDVKLDDQVQNLRGDTILRNEADCRLGETDQGTPVDINSPTCVDAIARVERYPVGSPLEGEVFRVRVNPINIANESTDGVDFGLRYKQPIGESSITFNASYTKVFDHESQQYVGDPVVDQFNPESGFVIPRSKATASVTFDTGPFSATLAARRLDKLANWDEDGFIPASTWLNASFEYEIAETVSTRLTIDNINDKKPVKDPTYSSYPYYDISWFDSTGRTIYLTVNYTYK